MNRLAASTGILLLLLLANTAYLAAFASPTIFYMLTAAAHVGLGLAFSAAGAWLLVRRPDLRRGLAPAAVLFLVAFAAGVYLVRWTDAFEGWGNITENRR